MFVLILKFNLKLQFAIKKELEAIKTVLAKKFQIHMIIASVKIIELITNYNNNTTSSEQRISYYRSDETDVEAVEIEAPVYKKMRGVGKIYDPQGTFETQSKTSGPGRPKNTKRALIKHEVLIFSEKKNKFFIFFYINYVIFEEGGWSNH
ncbi:hypothetical protein BpHYR1_015287 [Brachionus plicatilis]|uniref:Uncharacterized protein n=1 Tax=Brachionus plicatilis TaxID=10195 RepID=A0A3M7QQL2_BRAPC|nr:hypothetical protein BpHYR1_015287 [Brachionus plicatilis]